MDQTPRDLEDRQLAQRFLRSRSERSFRELYRRHTASLLQTVLRLAGGDRTEAEEIVQEAWIRAAARLEKFQWRSALRTWLTGIAVNVARERRRGAREEPRPTLQLVEERPDTAARLDLERAIAEMPPRYREVLVLHDVEGYTHREIGRMLGVEAGTSKSQLSRARGALRQRLSIEGEREHVRRR